MEEREKSGKGNERWSAAIANLSEMSSNLESLQKLLLKKAVFVDENTFSRASLTTEQARTIKVLEQRVETLERELDAAITAAAHARTEKRQAEAAQKAAELRAQDITKELENTSRVFELHMQEIRAKQEEIDKRDQDIKLLEAIIQTLGGKDPRSSSTGLHLGLHALFANMASMYSVYHGPEGLKAITQRVHGLAATFAAGLKKLGIVEVQDLSFFDTVKVKCANTKEIV